MKIFKIDVEQFPVYLTVDSTLYTADSTLITADKTIENTYPYRLKVIPRVTSQNVQFQLKNEQTLITSIIDIQYMQYQGDYLIIYFDFAFQEGDSFEIKVINLDNTDLKRNVIWRGKGYATYTDDLEDFKFIVKDSSGKTIMK